MSAFNLKSPNAIATIPPYDKLEDWISSEFEACKLSKHEAAVLRELVSSVNSFVKFAGRRLLLWDGCTRVRKYHTYPTEIKVLAKAKGIALDRRTNGPAIAAFLLSDGERPKRYGSNNGWSIHHIYSGKFPAIGETEAIWAAKSEKHMTQAAGLVAIHPIADQACDEYPFFAWYLRAMAFQKFCYDPKKVFCEKINSLGFADGSDPCVVVFKEAYV